MKVKELTTEYLKTKGFKEVVVEGEDVYDFDDLCTCCKIGNILKLELEIDRTNLKNGNLNNYPYFHDIKYYDEYLVATFDKMDGTIKKYRVAVRKYIVWKDNYCGD